jgi:pre-mRNA-processing factor 6
MAYRTKRPAAPRGYVAGLGRGAAGFTTRSDIGPAAPSSASAAAAGAEDAAATVGVSGGSRAAEQRAAKLYARQQQQNQQQQSQQELQEGEGRFGQAPAGYVAGAGRGMGGTTINEADLQGGPTGLPNKNSSAGVGIDNPYDEEDDEADLIYNAIDERMKSQKRKAGEVNSGEGGGTSAGAGGATESKIGDQFRELKQQLATVTEDQWAALPEVGDYSLRYKQRRREDTFTPLTDSLLATRSKLNEDATSGNTALSGTTVAAAQTGYKSVVTNMSGLAEARGTVLGMSLDKMSDSRTGQTVVDPKGYLTSLTQTATASQAEVGDIYKARLLLKSVRDTNPQHGPGWIAAARVEEAAGKLVQARKIMQEGCNACPANQDVWLEAARLHPPNVAKTILAAAARRIPHSVPLFLKASELETHPEAQRGVLRKGLEMNPNSVVLWKAAIELEEEGDARILLAVAVEKVPHSVEMWLALARLETYDNARRVLNQARKVLPAERAVWIAAAKLEECQNHQETVEKIIDKAIQSLAKNDAVISRDQWLAEAESAETARAPLTSAAIIKHAVGLGVDVEDQMRTWTADAAASLSKGAVTTARAILAHALASFPSKNKLWMQAVDLERKHGSAQSLDEVLAAASERLPKQEYFWLVRAKEKWIAGDVDKARDILEKAFEANPNSESVWLAAAKLEWETGEIDRARVLLERARADAPSGRVYMKSALLERECKRSDEALKLIDDGLQHYPKFDKLYMMGGQICSEDLISEDSNLNKARKFYQKGLEKCPECVTLWILVSALEEKTVGCTKARSILDLARLKNSKNPQLWVQSIRLERRAGNEKQAITLMARALQECPLSGLLLSENISTAPRVEQKSKSAEAIKKCPDNPLVIVAVASLFASERKNEKARKWFERAVKLNSDLGDSWVKYYALELEIGTVETQTKIKERCVKEEPHHGEIWCSIMKDMPNRRKSVGDILELVAQKILDDK